MRDRLSQVTAFRDGGPHSDADGQRNSSYRLHRTEGLAHTPQVNNERLSYPGCPCDATTTARKSACAPCSRPRRARKQRPRKSAQYPSGDLLARGAAQKRRRVCVGRQPEVVVLPKQGVAPKERLPSM